MAGYRQPTPATLSLSRSPCNFPVSDDQDPPRVVEIMGREERRALLQQRRAAVAHQLRALAGNRINGPRPTAYYIEQSEMVPRDEQVQP